MMELVKSLLVALVGGVAVTFVVLKYTNGKLEKWIEQYIAVTCEKVGAKYFDKLSRHSMAYEALIKREFDFYDQTTEYISQLNIDLQDVVNELTNLLRKEPPKNLEAGRQVLMNIFGEIPKYKTRILLAQSFVPQNIADECSKLSTVTQDCSGELLGYFTAAFSKKQLSDEENTIVEQIAQKITAQCAVVMGAIKHRINELGE
ncbi:MAG: hypothetical protein J6C75_07445 [Oscillospiraceae bacterium]|nr:hypothetical protein [Oscillospiraceae bacterium]